LHKDILIIDEKRFSRVCSAILEAKGYASRYGVDINHSDLDLHPNYGLAIMSYPYCLSVEFKKFSYIPVVVLSNSLDSETIKTFSDFSDLHFMIKPLDFDKLLMTVGRLINANDRQKGVIEIV